jgi:hypothetical protein
VADQGDRHHLSSVVDPVDDPEVPGTDAPGIGHPGELLAPWRPRIIGQPTDPVHDSLQFAALKIPKLLGHLRLELDLVWHQ